jgi:hypothetical protein
MEQKGMSDFTPRAGIVLFANERQNDRQPVMRGTITVTERLEPGEYEVSVWGKVSKKGNKFWSGEYKPKQARQAEPQPGEPDFDDLIPF